jgi:hypothetical protein
MLDHSKRRYAPDLMADPFYEWLEVSDNWIKVALLSWAVFFVAGFAAVALYDGESPGGISPPGARRTVQEPLDSHGSRCSAVAMA